MKKSTIKILIIVTITVISLTFSAMAEEISTARQPALYDYCGTYALRQTDPLLDGSGVGIQAVFRSKTYIDSVPQKDYHINQAHNCFALTQVTYDQKEYSSGLSDHATAIAALLAGSDPAAFNNVLGNFIYEGAAPGATIIASEFWDFLVDCAFACRKSPDADIITMSIGTSLPDWWTRALDSLAQQEGILITAGIGNGGELFDPQLYPAAGPNVLGVGVIDSIKSDTPQEVISKYWIAQKSHSSSGPTVDDRCKPDITAPANALVPSCADDQSYLLCGNYSSFATPVVAGSTALLIQKAKDMGLSDTFLKENGNCLLKSILMTCATKPAYWHKGNWSEDDDHLRPLDYIHGSGILNTQRAYDVLISGRQISDSNSIAGWDKDEVDALTEKSYFIIPPSQQDQEYFLQATLVWNKNFENHYPFNELKDLDVDLKLELWAQYEGSGQVLLADFSDSRSDNVEHLFFRHDPKVLEYELVVVFSERESIERVNISQKYALSWTFVDYQKQSKLFWYDLNGDTKINFDDVSLLIKRLGPIDQTDSTCTGDLNCDGVIDLNDLRLLKSHIEISQAD